MITAIKDPVTEFVKDSLENSTKSTLGDCEYRIKEMRQRGPDGDITEWADELKSLQKQVQDIRSGRTIPEDFWQTIAREINRALKIRNQQTDMNTNIGFRWGPDGFEFTGASCPKVGRPGKHIFTVDGEYLTKSEFLHKFGFYRNKGNVSWGGVKKHIGDLLENGDIRHAVLIRIEEDEQTVVWDEGDDW